MTIEPLFVALALVWLWPAAVCVKALMRIGDFAPTYRRSLVLSIAIGSIGAAVVSIAGVFHQMTFEQRMVGWIVVDFFMASGLVGAVRILRERPAAKEAKRMLEGRRDGAT